ncbi:MAG: aminotransferase class V-fold PLP-dependent enzyme, partial [Planctomycetes bacterium]|nr:aminotransferase class V-fold PLP-dependent enzyme [Planctomycetota bacterium]
MLWIPGPTEVRPEVLAELARPTIGHRTPGMTELHERIDPPLKHAFGLGESASSAVAVHSTSGTGMMEAALRGAGERVLCVVNGAFSRRFSQVAESLGKEVHNLDVAWGMGVEPEDLAAALENEGPFDAVTLVANETSTGVRTPLGPIGEVVRKHDGTHLLVDVVSYIAGMPVDFDTNGLDFAFAGVQKALAMPPGVAVFCASERYLERARSVSDRGFFLDPVRVLEGHVNRKTPVTPAIPHYYALARQLEDIDAGVTLPEGEREKRGLDAWQARYEKHDRMKDRTLAWASGHGLEPFPGEGFRSSTVSCVSAGSLDIAGFVAGLKEHNYEIS